VPPADTASTSLVLLNPHAGAGRAASHRADLMKALLDRGITIPLEAPDSIDEALALLMQQARGSRVVVVGGDGTLQQYLPAILAQQLEVGLVPLGSGNDLARALGLHTLSPTEALAHAMRAPAEPMDVGSVRWDPPASGGRLLQTQVHERQFVSSLAGGFDAQVALLAMQTPPWLGARLRYGWAIAKALLRLQHWPVQVFVDQQRLYHGPALLCSALNTATYGGGLLAAPGQTVDGGHLHALLAEGLSRWRTLLLLPKLRKGKHGGQHGMHSRGARVLWVHSQMPVPLAADGEYLGLAQQYRVQLLPGALRVVRGPAPAPLPTPMPAADSAPGSAA
jgi:diacylglycerol kinase (ATP)